MLTGTRQLQAFLYSNLSEQMPSPILTEDGELDVQADNEMLERWWFQTEDYTQIDESVLESFIVRTEQLFEDIEQLPEGSSSEEYMTLFYDAAKDTFNQDKSMIRTYFRWLYLLAIREHSGPRWGDFIIAYGPKNFTSMMREKFARL
jgi:lysyl-tRNA synthetase class I